MGLKNILHRWKKFKTPDNQIAVQSDAKRNPHYKDNKIIIVQNAISRIKTTCRRAETVAAFLQSAAACKTSSQFPELCLQPSSSPVQVAVNNNGKLLILLLLLYIWLAVFPHHIFFSCDVGPVSIVMSVSYLHISVWTTNYQTTRALFHIFFQYSTEPTTVLAEKNGGLQSIGLQRIKHD